MLKRYKRIGVTLAAAALLSASVGSVHAQEHAHAHSHEAAETAQLTLNNGKKWATDASLRQGMSRIRNALATELPTIHSGKATAIQYRALVKKVNDQIEFMGNNCKLDSEADAMLHLVLADIISGADAMAGQDSSKARMGVEKIAHALKNYAIYFDHPGWRGLK